MSPEQKNPNHRSASSGKPSTLTNLAIVSVVLAGQIGSGLLATSITDGRMLTSDRLAGLLSRFQYGWDVIAGTYGRPYQVTTFLAGAAAFSWFWILLAVTWGMWNRQVRLSEMVRAVARWVGPLALVSIAAALAVRFSFLDILPACALVAAAVFVCVVRMLGDAASHDASMASAGVLRVVGWQFLWAVVLGASMMAVLLMLKQAPRNGPENGVAAERCVYLSFDVEEDWSPRGDMVRMGEFPTRGTYYDSYTYIERGLLVGLAAELAKREAFATFYCTPEVARAAPDVLVQLEALGHEIGLHLHGHNVLPSTYPYQTNDLDDLATWELSDLVEAMTQAKKALDDVVTHPVRTFRSGGWAFSPNVIAACSAVGFTSISNQVSTYRLPCGMWQLQAARSDVFWNPETMCELAARSPHSNIIPLFNHPMVIYSRVTDSPRPGMVERFCATVDELRQLQPDLVWKTASQITDGMQYVSPASKRQVAVGGMSLIVILMSLVPISVAAFRGRQRKASGEN